MLAQSQSQKLKTEDSFPIVFQKLSKVTSVSRITLTNRKNMRVSGAGATAPSTTWFKNEISRDNEIDATGFGETASVSRIAGISYACPIQSEWSSSSHLKLLKILKYQGYCEFL